LREPQTDRERRERIGQTLAFVGTLVVVVVALYAAWITGRGRAERVRRPQGTRAVPSFGVTIPPTQVGSSSLRWYLPQSPAAEASLDPACHAGDPTLLQALFLGLTHSAPDEASGAVPVLADSWEVSDGGRVYTFYLRGDVFWVRCDPGTGAVQPVRLVTADDVVFAIERALRPEIAAPNASLLDPIVGAPERRRGEATVPFGVEAVNAFTVRFTLRAPLPDLPARLADPVAWPLPRELVEREGEQWTEPGTIWGNGPYCLSDWHPQRGPELLRNPLLPADLQPAQEERRTAWPAAIPVWVIAAETNAGLGFDPAGLGHLPALQQVLFLGLWMRAPQGGPAVPVLVESWEVSEGGRQHTIRIRPGVFWVRCDPGTLAVQRVREVTVADVVAGLARALYEYDVPELERIFSQPEERIDDTGRPFWVLPNAQLEGSYTLYLSLKEPDPRLDELLSLPLTWPVPEESVAVGHSYGGHVATFWSDGPYCALAGRRNGGMEVVVNPWLTHPEVLQSLLSVWDGHLLPWVHDVPDRGSP